MGPVTITVNIMNIAEIRFNKVQIDSQLSQMKEFFQNPENDFDDRWEAFKYWAELSNPVSSNYSVLDEILCEELVMYDQAPFYPERSQTIKIAQSIADIADWLGEDDVSENIVGRTLTDEEVPQVAEYLHILCKEQLMREGIASFTYDW